MEMIVKVKSKKNIYIKGRCHACHYNGKLDNNHRLATYIKKFPPKAWGYEQKKGKGGKNDDDGKKKKKPKKDDPKKKGRSKKSKKSK